MMDTAALKGSRIGALALARPTFDVPFAESVARAAFANLDTLGADIVGPRDLLFDAAAAEAAIAALAGERLDAVLVLQVTFTDATMTVALARRIAAPLVLWSFPEPRTGGRLRLNALCGINLAGHALGRGGRRYGYVHAPPDAPDIAARLGAALAREPARASPGAAPAKVDAAARAQAEAVLVRLAKARIGVVGAHPEGFDTCNYTPEGLARLGGVRAERIALPALFEAARAVGKPERASLRARVGASLAGVDALEEEPLDKSLALYAAMRGIVEARGLSGLAVRCWPEMFTEYGCAACGPMAMLNEERTPCACEADVYGNVTTLALQYLADSPAIIADLVDIDAEGDTGVLWHCGLAPLSMADPESTPRADIHSNRKKPLLNAFPLKPGRITIARLSQSKGAHRMVIGGATMLRAPMSFSGTSGVVRFDAPAAQVLDRVMTEGLEHHYAFAYGDVRNALHALADALALPVVALT